MTIRLISSFTALALTVASLSCASDKASEAPAPVATSAPAPAPAPLDKLARTDFNRRAAELALPIFWRTDANANNALDADELAAIWGATAGARADFVDANGFTQRMKDAYALMLAPVAEDALSADEKARRAAVRLELSQGRTTLVESDFTGASAEDKAIVKSIMAAAQVIEGLYAKQKGVAALAASIPADDAASKALFFRNQGPACEAPKTEKDPACSALPDRKKAPSGLYPASIQGKNDFCQVLEKRKDAQTLLHQFHVVTAKEGGKNLEDPAKAELIAVPYHEAYKAESTELSKLLAEAAAAIADPKEAAFKAYLEAASKSFLSGDWQPADEAWSKMNAENSKWYLRIGPDEVYFEPCSRKAGFHVSFARINQDSLEWQKKLEPHKSEMEKALAALAGPPYKARDVKFHLPDFIDIVVNAGDSRDALGGTIGQSLPNWGPVANEGRGRTVAMTNLYTDKDSEAAWTAQVSSLLCKDTMAKATFDNKLAVMSTVLHEAAHNLGPAHEYKVKGKTDDQIFGGPMASTLEELKSQTAALYFAEWLVEKNVVTREQADGAHVRDVTWAFGHIAQGMVNAEGKPKPYSQLASIQLGSLFKGGALVWKAEEMAANGADKGCLTLDLVKWKPTIDALAKRVLHTKGAGDKAEADKMKAELVDAQDDWSKTRLIIQERWLRAPKASFVYGVTL
jgi:hypothetical protein